GWPVTRASCMFGAVATSEPRRTRRRTWPGPPDGFRATPRPCSGPGRGALAFGRGSLVQDRDPTCYDSSVRSDEVPWRAKGAENGRADTRREARRGPFGFARRNGSGVQGLRGGHGRGLRCRGTPDRAGAARAAPRTPTRGRVFLRPGGDDRCAGR